MRVTGSRVYSRPTPVPKMPPGLVELMEGLTRDVLKTNPPDIYSFCADHMLKLLEIRDGPSNAKKLTLEQRIIKAQEKVKKRSEQRWKSFKDKEKTFLQKVVDEIEDCRSKTLDQNPDDETMQTFPKPVHHDHDLTLANEIEISCVNDASNDVNVINKEECENTKSDDSSKNNDAENILKMENNNLLDAGLETSEEVLQEDVQSNYRREDNAIVNILENVDLPQLEKQEPEIESGQAVELADKQDKKVLEEKSDPHMIVSDIIVSEDDTSFVKSSIEERNVGENGSLHINVVGVEEIENTSNPEEALVPNDSESGNGEELNKLETSDAESQKFVDVEEQKLNNNDAEIIANSIEDQDRSSEQTENKNVIAKIYSQNADEASAVNQEQNHENIDLEKVVNEAIDNIKRKDSSANESIKDVNILNEADSEESECVNQVDNDLTPAENVEVKCKNDSMNTANIVNDSDTDNQNFTENNIETQENNEFDLIKRPKRDAQESVVDDENLNMSMSKENFVSENNDSTDITNGTEEITALGPLDRNENTNPMDLETAAVTIQKVFRTFLFKSRASTYDETTNDENNLTDDEEKEDDRQFAQNNINKERRTLGISRMDTVLQTVNEEKSLSLSTDDSSLSSAATIIQAHVRGFLVRNKLHSGKTASSNSLAISNEPSATSMDGDNDQNKSKTILNIHIVPGSNYLSRDESMITSMDLSLDGSPPSSVNLHPYGHNTSERRKQLKREDAVQSVSPPSNNSGKLSEDVDSVKELTINENEINMLNQQEKVTMASLVKDNSQHENEVGSLETTPTNSLTIETVVGDNRTPNTEILSSPEPVTESPEKGRRSLIKQSSDEMDVVTPYKESNSPRDSTNKLLHSGEFHDAVLPTKVTRSDTPVASEFKNVMVYFLLWNKTTHSSF